MSMISKSSIIDEETQSFHDILNTKSDPSFSANILMSKEKEELKVETTMKQQLLG